MKAREQVACSRCSGVRYFEKYGHVANGTCFKCGGTGKQNAARKPSQKTLDKRAAERAAKKPITMLGLIGGLSITKLKPG